MEKRRTSFQSRCVLLLAAMFLTQCTSLNQAQQGALIGGAVGAGTGAIVGEAVDNEPLLGTAIGAASGAIIGGLIGYVFDRQDEQREQLQIERERQQGEAQRMRREMESIQQDRDNQRIYKRF